MYNGSLVDSFRDQIYSEFTKNRTKGFLYINKKTSIK